MNTELHNCGKNKEDCYSWTINDSPGEFRMIRKSLLHVDHTYQRDKISVKRLAVIRKEFRWMAFGVLHVAQRTDGTLWVFDGQHRKLSVDPISSIDLLPCLVWEVSTLSNEAKGFIAVNTCRGPMRSTDKFKSQVVAESPDALDVLRLLESQGLSVSYGIHTGIQCVKSISMMINRLGYDESLKLIEVIVKTCGKELHSSIIRGMSVLQQHLLTSKHDTLCSAYNAEAIRRIGKDGLLTSIQKTKAFLGKGGERVEAEGILMAINKGRSTRKLPSVYTDR